MGLVFKRDWVVQLIWTGSAEVQEGAKEEGEEEGLQWCPGITSAHILIQRRR